MTPLVRPFALPALVALCLAAPSVAAFAQEEALPSDAETPSATNVLPTNLLIEIDDDDLIVEPFNITIEELDGMMLFGSDGGQFGEIEAVLGDSDGTIAAFAIEVGGFLGVGNRQVVFPVSAIIPDGLRLTVDLAASDLESHPFWAD